MLKIPNATISYQNVTTTLTIDPITGETLFSTINGSTESIQVSIEEDNLNNQVSNLPGKDRTEVFCTGRLIEPQVLPDWYVVGSELDIVLSSGKQGKFYVMQPVPSRFGLELVFGEAIAGILYGL
ncbi:MAG: hypothetical protein ACRC80_26675 [Waterburya sp.]